jgi:DUF1009 family protein
MSGVHPLRLADPVRSQATSVAHFGQPPVGVIAGWGNYPLQVVEALHQRGVPVVVAALRDCASPELASMAKAFQWFGICKVGAQRRWLKRQGVQKVVLAGKLFKHEILFQRFGWMRHLPDLECLQIFTPHLIRKTSDASDNSLLGAVVRHFEKKGMQIVPGTHVAPELLAPHGLLTRRSPSWRELKDLRFGWTMAKRMGDLDVGQTVTVRDQTVLGVEAIEGTDACLVRTGQLCPRGGFSMVKVAKPSQDDRFDLPTIGRLTLETLLRAGGTALAIEAHRTILLEREASLDFANQNGIAIVSWTDADLTAPVPHSTAP